MVTLQDLSIRFRGPALLDEVNCIIEPGQRIGLLGRNGAGKTTLLKILSGVIEADHGSVQWAPGTRVALLQQDVPQDLAGTVHEVVRSGISTSGGADDEEIQDWEIDHKVDQILSRMELDPTASVASMSSGMKRRVLLARALVDAPDLLLLDEPTNHLDIDAIRWLEDFLTRWNKAYIFITHDRQFLRKLASRILEIDGGQIFDWTCDYDTFLTRKEEALAALEKQNALFDKKLAEEEVWIRQGIKARRTRNEGRVRALEKLRSIRSERREKIGTSNLQIQEAGRSGTLVARVEGISFAHPAREGQAPTIIQDFSTTLFRGDKVGIVGPNGVGKTTLLKLLLGELEPQAGNVRLGTNLQVAYFDQLRDQLDPNRTVEEDVADGYENINLNGKPRHVLGYLQDFLFTPARARTPIKQLSGGERNRVLLAKLFAKPANVVVLDEPTNDLDAETLEMLEERLVDYTGTLIVVSHDREFLNNVVSSTLVFEVGEDGNYRIGDYVGGYDDWLRQSRQRQQDLANAAKSPAVAAPVESGNTATKPLRKKLTFKEQQELAAIPKKINDLELATVALHDAMAAPDFYKLPGDQIALKQAELAKIEAEIAKHLERWEELES
nr:ATP-binding cassette domain-containing protein [Aureliella helgolandensis]